MGYRIKEVRVALKMSQEELCEKSGISRGTVSALENGTKRAVSTKTLVKLAQALNTTVDKIFLPIVCTSVKRHRRRRTWTRPT